MAHLIEIAQKHTVQPSDINDIIGTALYGGITYWCANVDPVMDENDFFKGVEETNQDSIDFISELIGFGGELILHDVDTPETWILNTDKVLKGITQYCQRNNVSFTEMMDMLDAEIANHIIQYGLFGTIEFA